MTKEKLKKISKLMLFKAPRKFRGVFEKRVKLC